jgi:hypothetical protein
MIIIANLWIYASALAWSPWPKGQRGDQAFFVFWGFMNEMNKFPFKSFRLLGKNGIEIIPNTVHFPGLIW